MNRIIDAFKKGSRNARIAAIAEAITQLAVLGDKTYKKDGNVAALWQCNHNIYLLSQHLRALASGEMRLARFLTPGTLIIIGNLDQGAIDLIENQIVPVN